VTITLTGPGTFTDPELKSLMDSYRQLVAQRYIPCPPSDLARLLAAPPYHVSRKFDGELWFLIAGMNEVQLVAANGRTMTGAVPVLDVSLPPGTVLVGELHVAKGEARERVGDVRTALSIDPASLAFAAFDIIVFQEQPWRKTHFLQRLGWLRSLLPDTVAVRAIAVTTVEAEVDVAGLFSDIVDASGAEGIIVRCSDGRGLKVKPEVTIDAAILGFTNRAGANGQEVRSVLLGINAGDGQWVPLGTAGNMLDGIDRVALLGLLEPLVLPSVYRRAASTGQLYCMVRPEFVVESRVLDVQVEDSRGRPIRQPQLVVRDGQWDVGGQVAAASLLNASVIRIRDDKPDAAEGASWRQIEPYVTAPAGERGELPTSAVIGRQVWTKTGKDKTDVRKLVVWKTNKGHLDPTYPAYVVHWTDYSSGRKTPLTREVRPAPNEEAASQLAEAMIADNVKKGWELHGV